MTPGTESGGSWTDRLTARIDGMPGPAGVAYVVAGLAVLLMVAGVEWIFGEPPRAWSVDAPHLAVGVTFGAWLYLIGRFNRSARDAIAGLARAGQLRHPESQATLAAQITAAPPWLTLVLGAVIASIVVGRIATRPEALAQISISSAPVSVVTIALVLGTLAFIGSAYAVKVLSIARGIADVLASEAVVSLDAVGHLYAFSRLTAAMSISVVATATLLAVSAPSATEDPWGVIMLVTALALAAATFAVPLNGVHARLMEEKDRLLARNQQQFRSVAGALHEAVQHGDLERMDPLQKAIAGLDVEMRLLAAIPTWPWRPETLRWVVGALMFPFLLFLVQQLFQRTLLA